MAHSTGEEMPEFHPWVGLPVGRLPTGFEIFFIEMTTQILEEFRKGVNVFQPICRPFAKAELALRGH